MKHRRKAGTDNIGNPVTLGDVDADGRTVGFIDRNGMAWESRGEKAGALAAGRFVEAALAFQRGERRTRPVRVLFALRYGPLVPRTTLREIDRAVEFQRRLGRGRGRLG